MMPLYPSSVFSVGAVKLGQHLNILSFNLRYGVGFCISSPRASDYWIPAALGSLPWAVQLTSVEGKSTSWTQMRALSAITSSCWGKECFRYWGWGGPEWTYMYLLICIALQMLNNTQ